MPFVFLLIVLHSPNHRFDDAREQCLDEYESKLRTDLETLDKPNAAYVAAHNRHYLKMRTPIVSGHPHWEL